ncbi:chitinase [Arthrobacter stackebrandtii]|uniref:chitinase n=1 Tax=Arthrobacter stackebrandtii TaxID=272161 RepID=A0ABS4YUE1_9MICC|nr:glycosyl hydrolase family 18 protein [Arthrobacter stackebrandtii]MBP2412419.1 chitinase [Arthrobacter stackebrandtii]PYH02186.1 chitinase [Arthrobacter stackebrandtii]
MSEFAKRRGRISKVMATLAAGAMVAGMAGGLNTLGANAAPVGDTASAPQTSTVNGYRNVGYFAQWGVYGRAFQAKQLDVSGAANNLTHINYSFGNINNQTLKCFMANKAQGTGPNGSDGAGDAWADFGMGYTADKSVSGVADSWDQPLAGSFNQLKQLKAKHPQLKVMISLGGWTWSKNFSAAAATKESREKLVSSCIDLYIKGNLPVFEGRGGPGAAAGIFDGIDIDWEWPGSPNGEVGNIVDEVNDRANFKALLAEFRKQLDEYGATQDRKYMLSAFMPANIVDIEAGGWNDPENFKSLDYGNIQGYDLHGAWDSTLAGHQGNLYDDPTDTRAAHRQFSVDKAVKAYTSNGVDPKQLTIGLAAYGRGWTGVASEKAWSAATDGAPGTWEKGIEDYTLLKNRGTDYYDATLGAAWRYDGTQWWSYDNAQTTKQKTDYIVDNGLGGGMWWELDGDKEGELSGIMATDFRGAKAGPISEPAPPVTGNPGDGGTNPTDPPAPGECKAAAWNATSTYTAGTLASYNGVEYKAKWWIQGAAPGTDAAWEKVTDCDGSTTPTEQPTETPTDVPTDTPTDVPTDTPTDTPTDVPTVTPTENPGGDTCAAAWAATATYVGGDTVTLDGVSYKAKWWNLGDKPGASQWGPWENLGACA